MNRVPPPYYPDWKEGRSAVVSVFSGGLWLRGLASQISGQNYSVFLIDCGAYINVTEEELRALPDEFLDVPAFSYQV